MNIVKPLKDSVEVYDGKTLNRKYTLPIAQQTYNGLIVNDNQLTVNRGAHSTVYDLTTGMRKATI